MEVYLCFRFQLQITLDIPNQLDRICVALRSGDVDAIAAGLGIIRSSSSFTISRGTSAPRTMSVSSGIAPRKSMIFTMSFLWCSIATEMIGNPDWAAEKSRQTPT